MNIVLIGAGNMGSALYAALPKETIVVDHSQEKLDALGAQNTTTNASEAVKNANIVIFAIKPQSFEECCAKLDISEDAFVISIMAGITIEQLKKLTKSPKIVRSMPNLGVKVSAGVTGWIATESVTQDEKAFVQNLFKSCGESVEVQQENQLDAITALSATGLAYFFYLTELLTQKAEDFGFSPENAERIAKNTAIGSAKLLEENEKTAQEWKDAVTSKGGTTEAALNALEERAFNKTFFDAVDAAKHRSEELSTNS